ncbi:carbohydrate ABC transporter permease [Acidaminobacter sp. JC074]|uniref:carbohydrate ABC transporter permease n=1 Tax=Acidaminobacter sp. JC074 TaxID=2530199 RepID=UPI001F0CF4FA|nr:carbohydrate ABC transporter permease [Acidaminobacter sp. JC074]
MKLKSVDKFTTVVIYLLAGIAAIMALYPIYFVVIASISSPDAVENGLVYLWPKYITFEGYEKVFQDARIWMGYRNTIFYTLAGTAISLLVTLPAAFVLSRKDFKARNTIMMMFVFTMFFGGGLIPTYLLIKDLNLYNTIWVMILPFSLNVYNLIIARSFFESSIPESLGEAAKIDGCSDIRFFISIILPLSKAIIAVILLYYAVAQWNEYFKALIYLRDENLQTLQIVLRSILIQNQSFDGSAAEGFAETQNLFDLIKYAVIVVSTIPIIMVYPFVQKYFTKGVMIGAVKG